MLAEIKINKSKHNNIGTCQQFYSSRKAHFVVRLGSCVAICEQFADVIFLLLTKIKPIIKKTSKRLQKVIVFRIHKLSIKISIKPIKLGGIKIKQIKISGQSIGVCFGKTLYAYNPTI